jgi:hypothetical protein
MPISSYPRITLIGTQLQNNPQSGTGLSIYDNSSNTYKVADSDLFPINFGGLAANDSLYSDLGPKLPNLLVDVDDTTIANRTRQVEENLRSINYNNESAGDLLAQILIALSGIESMLANGTGAIQIKGSNGNLAHVSSTNKLDVRL